VQFESSKFQLLNELECLEETLVRRQQELHDVEEVLERHKTDLGAIQMEVSFSTFICIIVSFFKIYLSGALFDVVLLRLLMLDIVAMCFSAFKC